MSAPAWRARLSEGWCPRVNHPQLDLERFCAECGWSWVLDAGIGPHTTTGWLSLVAENGGGLHIPQWALDADPGRLEVDSVAFGRMVDKGFGRRVVSVSGTLT